MKATALKLKSEEKDVLSLFRVLPPLMKTEALSYLFYLKEKEEWEATWEVMQDGDLLKSLQKGLEAEASGKLKRVKL
jgi:hypothetical protein